MKIRYKKLHKQVNAIKDSTITYIELITYPLLFFIMVYYLIKFIMYWTINK